MHPWSLHLSANVNQVKIDKRATCPTFLYLDLNLLIHSRRHARSFAVRSLVLDDSTASISNLARLRAISCPASDSYGQPKGKSLCPLITEIRLARLFRTNAWIALHRRPLLGSIPKFCPFRKRMLVVSLWMSSLSVLISPVEHRWVASNFSNISG